MKFGKSLALIFLLVLGLVFVGCSQKKAIVVGGESLSEKEFKTELERFKKALESSGMKIDKNQGKELEKQVLEQLITKTVEYNEAKKAKVMASDEEVNKRVEEIKKSYGKEESFKKMLKDQNMTLEDFEEAIRYQLTREALYKEVTKNVTVKEEDIKKYYDENPMETEVVKVRYILVSKIKHSDADAKKIAGDLISKLKKGTSFEALAKSSSEDAATKGDGGLMANPGKKGDFYIPRSQLMGDIQQEVQKLKTGQYSTAPVLTSSGYIIVKVEEVKKLTLAEAKKDLESKALLYKKAVAYNEFLQKARKDSNVKTFLDDEKDKGKEQEKDKQEKK